MVYLRRHYLCILEGLLLSVPSAIFIIDAFIGSASKLVLSALNEKYDNDTSCVHVNSSNIGMTDLNDKLAVHQLD